MSHPNEGGPASRAWNTLRAIPTPQPKPNTSGTGQVQCTTLAVGKCSANAVEFLCPATLIVKTDR